MPLEIVDVTLRDGLQNETPVLPTRDKVALADRLIDAGLRRIEAVSFVNPKRVPQMADAEAVMAELRGRPGVSLAGLVLNARGIERAMAAGVDEISFVVVASDTFNQRNQGVPTAETVKIWSDLSSSAAVAGLHRTVTIGAAFGCSFEGRVEHDRVVAIAEQVAEAGVEEIAVADTIGAGTPKQVRVLVEALKRRLPGVPLRAHFHNTRNTGYANAAAAVESGVSALDASTGGVGGCPFAPAATGNIATEDLLYLLDGQGYDTGVEGDALCAAAAWLESRLETPVPGLLRHAGWFPPAKTAARS